MSHSQLKLDLIASFSRASRRIIEFDRIQKWIAAFIVRQKLSFVMSTFPVFARVNIVIERAKIFYHIPLYHSIEKRQNFHLVYNSNLKDSKMREKCVVIRVYKEDRQSRVLIESYATDIRSDGLIRMAIDRLLIFKLTVENIRKSTLRGTRFHRLTVPPLL